MDYTDKKQAEQKKKQKHAVCEKISFPKAGNFLYPVPPVMVSCQDAAGKANIITVAWAGTICSDPPMLSVSIRKERYSHALIAESGEFVVNLASEALAWATDYCGVKSGRDVDKYRACGLTVGKSVHISAPTIQEAPVSLECKVKQVLALGSHDMFLAEVVGVQVDARYLDEKGGFHLEQADLIAYSHGRYFGLGEQLGTFGYSVRKKATLPQNTEKQADKKQSSITKNRADKTKHVSKNSQKENKKNTKNMPKKTMYIKNGKGKE